MGSRMPIDRSFLIAKSPDDIGCGVGASSRFLGHTQREAVSVEASQKPMSSSAAAASRPPSRPSVAIDRLFSSIYVVSSSDGF